MKIGPESLIPIGLFEHSEKRGLLRRRKREPLPAAIQARVLLSGAIEERETRRNTVSSAEFLKLRTRTYGATFDILASPNEVPDDVSPGWVVQVEAWMVGTIDV
jgi:hypothetical protein